MAGPVRRCQFLWRLLHFFQLHGLICGCRPGLASCWLSSAWHWALGLSFSRKHRSGQRSSLSMGETAWGPAGAWFCEPTEQDPRPSESLPFGFFWRRGSETLAQPEPHQRSDVRPVLKFLRPYHLLCRSPDCWQVRACPKVVVIDVQDGWIRCKDGWLPLHGTGPALTTGAFAAGCSGLAWETRPCGESFGSIDCRGLIEVKSSAWLPGSNGGSPNFEIVVQEAALQCHQCGFDRAPF